MFDKDSNLLTEQTSDNSASYEVSVRVNRNAYPLLFEASGGQDIVTGGQPDFILNSVLLTSAGKARVNINPFSTLIVRMALEMPGGLTVTNVALAKQVVLQQMNFGFDQAVMPDPIISPIDQTNIAVIVRSSEALGEMLRRTRDTLQMVESTVTADDVVSALAADLTDGNVDGMGTANADARIAAISNIASAQVLIEVMAGALKVNNVDAGAAMDNAVLVSMPSIASTISVNDLPIVSEMIAQASVVLTAAQAIDSNPVFVETANVLSSMQAGSQPIDLAAVLPTEISTSLTTTLTNVVVASEASLEQVNSVVRLGGQGGQGSGNVNSAPTISGTPGWSVAEGTTYRFSPTVSDADDDVLSFSVSNLPTWASFNSATGSITGTPGSADVGQWSAIVISVNDGVETVSLPAFSITVSGIPNTVPVISGTPVITVTGGAAYNFVPTANDADGDTLSFSVSNLPAWASFNIVTGAITGAPSNSDAGVTSNIVISVSDGSASVSLPAFNVSVIASVVSTGTATLSWMPPTENTDGSVLTDLAGYKIYYGTSAGSYTTVVAVDNPGISTYVVDSLPGGYTYYFVITSVTTSGLESEYSTVGSKAIP